MTKPLPFTEHSLARAIRGVERAGHFVAGRMSDGTLIIGRKGLTFIYFLRAGDFVKIGRAKRWKYRMRELQTGSAHAILPLLVIVGEPSLEKKLHRRFRKQHYRGEWFRMSPVLSRYIKVNLFRCVAKSGPTELA